jgi:thiamine monophosphate synthase
VLAAGVARVAAGSAIIEAPDPAAAARQFVHRLQGSPLAPREESSRGA